MILPIEILDFEKEELFQYGVNIHRENKGENYPETRAFSNQALNRHFDSIRSDIRRENSRKVLLAVESILECGGKPKDVQIAKMVGLSVFSVKSHLRQLHESGLLQVTFGYRTRPDKTIYSVVEDIQYGNY